MSHPVSVLPASIFFRKLLRLACLQGSLNG
uniref:Uncharacterized protein n=1 Tax=Anguilla anguilla TaxID=7936 RepID=A0A0E9SVC0_ANGAN